MRNAHCLTFTLHGRQGYLIVNRFTNSHARAMAQRDTCPAELVCTSPFVGALAHGMDFHGSLLTRLCDEIKKQASVKHRLAHSPHSTAL